MAAELRLPIPAGWIHVEPDDPDLLVMMAPPHSDTRGALRPVVGITRLDLGPSEEPPRERLLSHQTHLSQELRAIFEWSVVEDADVLDLSGHDVSYVRISHQRGQHCLVSELWTWLLGDQEWTITGTTPVDEYSIWCDVFEAIAGAFSPEEVWQERRAG